MLFSKNKLKECTEEFSPIIFGNAIDFEIFGFKMRLTLGWLNLLNTQNSFSRDNVDLVWNLFSKLSSNKLTDFHATTTQY